MGDNQRGSALDRRQLLKLLASSAFLTSCAIEGDFFGAPPNRTDEGTRVLREEVDATHDIIPIAYYPEARSWVVQVAPEHRRLLADGLDPSLGPGIRAGYLALYQTCPKLGCRVPECGLTSFLCPCCETAFSLYGEHRGGEAPRGLDMFAITAITEESFVIEAVTSGFSPIPGLPPDVDLSGLPATPELCLPSSTRQGSDPDD